MSDQINQSAKSPAQDRDARLKAALKSNMAKRKAQARARQAATSQESKDD